MAVRREYVSSLYRDILGREGSDQEIEGHLNNPGGERGLYDLFQSVAGNKSDGQVNEATVGSAPQVQYESNYQTPGDTAPIIPQTPPNVSGGYSAPAASAPAVTTDQWSGSDTVMPTTNFGRMTGYDLSNFNNNDMQTLKYQAGRIASRYDPANPNALTSLMNDPEFRRLFPNAKVVDARSGTVNFGSAGDVDVIKNFGAADAQWAWQPTNGAPGSGSASGGSGSGGGSGSAARSTVGDLRSLYQTLGSQYGGVGDAGITNGDLQQVGQDPLSQLITGALASFIGNEGKTRFGGDVEAALAGLLDRGGNIDDGQVARRYESARELLDKGRRTMINDLEGDLVSRNLMSEPGIPQGAHIGGLNRITEKIAPEFSRALRDIYTDESAKADTRLMTSLQMATGMASDQARNLLAGIGEGTARQSALADIALRSLQTNMAWSQFLAEFGLNRDKVMYDIQNGQVEDILPILQAFMQLSGMANQGYV